MDELPPTPEASTSPVTSGVRERIGQPLDPIVVRYLVTEGLERDARSMFDDMLVANIVHSILLFRARVLSRDSASALIDLYREMSQSGYGCLRLDPQLEDLHFNIEAFVAQRLGPDVGGRMHTGRSRNDLYATVGRMRLRTLLLQIIDAGIRLRGTLLTAAERYAEVVMPGYTHLRPAQPITFGHYLLAAAGAFQRDTRRQFHAYQHANESPLGAGALAGVNYPLDRRLAASLLGFDGLVENSIDAVASRDYVLEALAALSIFGVNASRIANDLYVWSTEEFGYLDVSGELSIVSSIMPQKKNPIVLEHCKAKAAHLISGMVSASVALHSAPYSNVRDANREAMHAVADSFNQAEAVTELLGASIIGIRPHPEKMLAAARSDFSTVTDLADHITQTVGVPFRLAHQIVARAVGQLAASGLDAGSMTSDLLDECATQITGAKLGLADADVQRVLDPQASIRAKRTIGSPNPRAVRSVLRHMTATLDGDRKRLDNCRGRVADASRRLTAEVRRLRGEEAVPIES